MTLPLHKLTAGTGYTYLTRQVAAHDRAGGPRTTLATYYSERGETPGRWVGSGVAGIDGMAVGDEALGTGTPVSRTPATHTTAPSTTVATARSAAPNPRGPGMSR